MFRVILDPDFLLDDNGFVWGRQHEVGGEKDQVVALMKGDIPNIFISGVIYGRTAEFDEQPALCYRCSRWGHMAWEFLRERPQFVGMKK